MNAPIPRDIPDLPALPGMPSLPHAPVPAAAVVPVTRRPLAAAVRLLIALMAAGAVAVEVLSGPSVLRVLSHFAVQSALLLAAVQVLSARRARTARRPLPSGVTGAVLLYVTITALVHHLLLTRTTPPFAITPTPATPPLLHHAANVTLYTLVPAAALLEWLLLTTPGRLHLRQAAPWLLYPLAYLAFTLTRGELIPPGNPGRYLYPFLDVARHGYRHVLGNALLLGLSFYALALLLVALDHARPNPVRRRLKTGFRLQPPVG